MFILIIFIINIKCARLGTIRNGTRSKVKIGCQYDWNEIYNNLEGGESVLTHGQDF